MSRKSGTNARCLLSFHCRTLKAIYVIRPNWTTRQVPALRSAKCFIQYFSIFVEKNEKYNGDFQYFIVLSK